MDSQGSGLAIRLKSAAEMYAWLYPLLTETLQTLTAQDENISRLQTALVRYGGHDPTCGIACDPPRDCTCGYQESLDELTHRR